MGSANVGGSLSSHVYQAPLPSDAAENFTRSVLSKLGPVIGDQLASLMSSQPLGSRDTANVRAHSAPVFDSISGGIDYDDLSTKQKKQAIDWAEGAADVNPNDDARSAAWRAALKDIFSGDYRLIQLVKELHTNEIKQLLRVNDRAMIRDDFSEKLIDLGLVRKVHFFWGGGKYRDVGFVSAIFVLVSIVYLASDDIISFLKFGFGPGGNRDKNNLLFSLFVVVYLSCVFYFGMKYVRGTYNYRLTSLGRTMVDRINAFMPQDRADAAT